MESIYVETPSSRLIQHGFSKSFSEAQRCMASRFIARGFDPGEIADLTGRTEQEIAEIRTEETGRSSGE